MLENLIRDKSRKDGTAVLLSSHDMEEIEKVCDRIVIMKDGNVVFDNAFEEKQIAHIQLKVQGKEFEKYLNLFPWRGKVTVLTNANGLIEVKDMEILGEVLNQLGKDGMIEKVYTKENSIQELFDSVTRKVL